MSRARRISINQMSHYARAVSLAHIYAKSTLSTPSAQGVLFNHGKTILLIIMCHAPMVRFQLELIYCFTFFSTVVPSNICRYFSLRLSLLIQHFQQVLWVLKLLLSPAHLSFLDLIALTILGER